MTYSRDRIFNVREDRVAGFYARTSLSLELYISGMRSEFLPLLKYGVEAAVLALQWPSG